MPATPKVWLSERALPTVRMRLDEWDLMLVRRDGVWWITAIKTPDGGPLMQTGDEFRCNHSTILRLAEEAYEDTPQGATFPKYKPKSRSR